MRALFFVGWLLLLATTSAQQPSATPGARPVRILFVGNSFTHGKYRPVRTYNAAAVTDENAGLPAGDPRAFHPGGESGPYGGLPGIFKKMTDEIGLNYEVHIEAVSAKDLAFHYEHALSVIARPGWDVVVLQGYSTEPLSVKRGGNRESFLANVTLLTKAIRAANPRTKIFLEETWPRADLVYPEHSPYHDGSVGQMAVELQDGFSRAEKECEVPGIQVCDTWWRALGEDWVQSNPYLPTEAGKLDLWGPDHYHPSVYGAYLGAAVLFSNIARVDADQLPPDEQAAHDLGISSVDATRLRRLVAPVFAPRAVRQADAPERR